MWVSFGVRCLAWVTALWLWMGSAAATTPEPPFVTVRGGQFFIGNQPFRFIGANADPLHGPLNRKRHVEILEAVAADGLRVVRIWAVGEAQDTAGTWLRQHHLFRAGPYGFIEESYELLDHVLVTARRLGLRVILTLANHWGDYGGVPMYLAWAAQDASGLGRDAFYSHPRVREFYRAGLLKLLTRRNTLTGQAYSDDPTIFSWELMNESEVLTDAGAAARLLWIREMAALIRTHDSHHLISPGLLGYRTLRERQRWMDAHALPEVSYCDSHLYPFADGTALTQARLYDLIDDRAQLAQHVLKKPLVLGEFGFRTDGHGPPAERPRGAWFTRFLSRSLRDQTAGVLAWIYEPWQLWNGKPRDYGIHIDHAGTSDVRAILRRNAALLTQGTAFLPLNPRLVPQQGLKPLYEAFALVRGPSTVHNGWQRSGTQTSTLAISPLQFDWARFERAGTYQGPMAQAAHFYGADKGEVSYRFAAPPRAPTHSAVPTQVSLSVRLSSEWPGAAAPADGGSQVHVLLDGALIATLLAPPDDGQGAWQSIEIREPARLASLARGLHTIAFRVLPNAKANGLCIYGEAVGNNPQQAKQFGPMQLRYQYETTKAP